MPLPDAWVDRIFEKLTVVYGHQFLARWDGLPIAEVKANWGEELGRFQQHWPSIAFGLDNLPPAKPPTVLEFRALCASPQAPRQPVQAKLPEILARADEPAVQRHLERIRDARFKHGDRWAWAHALAQKDREDPDSVSPTVRAMYREALANHQRRDFHAEEEAA